VYNIPASTARDKIDQSMFSDEHHVTQDASVKRSAASHDGDNVAIKRTSDSKEKRGTLDITSIELELMERMIALKAQELELKKRERDFEYESIDKAVDRFNTYCLDGDQDRESVDNILKEKYRRMIEDA
jgi:hypothetical protein